MRITFIVLAATALSAAAWWSLGRLGTPEAFPVSPMTEEVLLLVDSGDPYAAGVADQARFTLTRARVPFSEHDVVGATALPRLGGFRAVLTAVERLDRLDASEADRLGTFVEEGGGLGVLYRGESLRLRALLGLPTQGDIDFGPEAEGTFVTAASLMPGGDGLRLEVAEASAYDVPAPEGCDALAHRESASGDASGPAGWTCARGAGRVVFWNVALFGAKPFRGHILQTLALLHPGHARPVAGWGVVFLDDFTAPASNAELEPVWSRYGQTPAQYYADTWYPDMRRLADDADLVYTSAVVYAYNGRTTAPFGFREWLSGSVHANGRTVPFSPWMFDRDSRHSEQGLHGYNHQPLQLDRWGQRERMVEALRAARLRWESEGAAPLPAVYVPPMNLIDSVGVAVLREVFPELRTIAGLYTGEVENGEGREFGPEPWAPELYALPRTTAGYVLTEAERLKMLSVLHTVGAWNHFVHPDEVYPNAAREAVYRAEGLRPPSEIGWNRDGEGLLPAFAAWVEGVREHYPWVEFVTASEAADRMRDLDEAEIAWRSEHDGGVRRLGVEVSRGGQKVMTWSRPGERLVDVDGGRLLHTWDGAVLSQHVVEVRGGAATITFESVSKPAS